MAKKDPLKMKIRSRDNYLELVMNFPLASIKSEEELELAQATLDDLLAEGELDEGRVMYVDALSDLIAFYESQRHHIEPASDAEMLRHLMEAKIVTQTQLSRETSVSKSTISEVLAGKKPFTRQLIRKFAAYFNVDVSILAANL